MLICENGKLVERDVVLDDTMTETAESPAVQPDRVQQLAAGLATATTIAQIRSVAKQVLDETGGGDIDE